MSLYYAFFSRRVALGHLEVNYSRGMHFLCLIPLLNMTLKRRSTPFPPENELNDHMVNSLPWCAITMLPLCVMNPNNAP